MAEGEDPFAFKDPDLDNNLDNDDNQEVNTTGPFQQPQAASTPHYRDQLYEMQTMMHERAGMPDNSFEETPLLGAQSEAEKSWDALTSKFPNASATDLVTSYSKTGRLQVKITGFGKKSYHLFTRDNNTGQERLNPSLPKEMKNSLGKTLKKLSPKTEIQSENNAKDWQKQKTNTDRQRR